MKDHIDGIYDKLVSIMKERLVMSTKQLSQQSVTWNRKNNIYKQQVPSSEEEEEVTVSDKKPEIAPTQISQQVQKQLKLLTQVLFDVL